MVLAYYREYFGVFFFLDKGGRYQSLLVVFLNHLNECLVNRSVIPLFLAQLLFFNLSLLFVLAHLKRT